MSQHTSGVKSICDFFSDATRVKIAIVKSTNKTHAAAFLFPKQEYVTTQAHKERLNRRYIRALFLDNTQAAPIIKYNIGHTMPNTNGGGLNFTIDPVFELIGHIAAVIKPLIIGKKK